MRPPSNQSIPCGKISLSVGDQIIIKILGLLTDILTSPSWAQDLIIPTVSATVQEFININGTDMSLLTASCETFDACRDMNYHSKTYTFIGNAQSDQKKQGGQRISFHQDGENINIVHETRYKSSSKFRDNYLYGHFHTELLDVVWDDFSKNL